MNSRPAPIQRGAVLSGLLEPLRALMETPEITEICVNRPGEAWSEAHGVWTSHVVKDLSLDHLTSIATAVARFALGEITDSRPILSAVLPQGERIQIVIPPACEPGTVALTIRKPAQVSRTLGDYASAGFFNHFGTPSKHDVDERELQDALRAKDVGRFLRLAVATDKTIVVSGETGSGKTTLMKALIGEIPKHQRIITIEDVPELLLPSHPNHVHLFYPSEAKEEENAPVTAASLLRSCLRMKPTRILLAELRGGETFDFLNVAASGHGGSITSCHAGSVAQTFERLSLMVLQNRQGRTLPYDVVRRLLFMIIDVVVQVRNDVDGGRGRHVSDIWFDPAAKRVGATTDHTPPAGAKAA